VNTSPRPKVKIVRIKAMVKEPGINLWEKSVREAVNRENVLII
jgi:hypothetical protein